MRARRGISLFEAVAALAIVGVTAVSALSALDGVSVRQDTGNSRNISKDGNGM